MDALRVDDTLEEQGLHIVEAPKYEVLDRSEVLHSKRVYWVVRRAQDILFSALALLLLWPLFLMVVVAIHIDDPKGSSIFKQTRCGRDGKLFTMYKFRTMHAGAEEKLEDLLDANEMDGPVFKIKDDPRITRVGKFLRKTSIDEMPQFINVLLGQMSIVGPRPAIPREAEQYNEYQKQRLFVQPGLTCYWQIQPNRNNISFDDWMEMDIHYIKERSFITDWKIILATIGVVFRFEGI